MTKNTSSSAEPVLEAMWQGLLRHRELIGMTLPRVAPEHVIVACAAKGILERFGDDARVAIEEKRRDLTVELSGVKYWFEFKLLWPNGVTECLGGIERDLHKKLAAPEGYDFGFAAAFAYAVVEVPASAQARKSPERLDDTLTKAKTALGPWAWSSSREEFSAHGARSEGQLVAWLANCSR